MKRKSPSVEPVSKMEKKKDRILIAKKKKVKFAKKVKKVPIKDDEEILANEQNDDFENINQSANLEFGKMKTKKKRKKHIDLEEELVREAEDCSNDTDDSKRQKSTVAQEESKEDSDSDSLGDLEDHKATLNQLQQKDPEFFKYLQENAQDLLEFQVDDDEVLSDDDDKELEEVEDDEEIEEGEEEEIYEKKPKKLVTVTDKLLDEWSQNLQEKADVETIKKIIRAFKSANNHLDGSGEISKEFKIEGPQKFNSIMRLCLIDLLPAVCKVLRLPPPTQTQQQEGKLIDPSKSRNWKKLHGILKVYLTQIVKVLDVVSDPSVIASLLRHILYLVPFFCVFVHLTKRILRKLMSLWSGGEEKVRVLAFLGILRLMRNQESLMLSFILKKLYFSYVKNARYTTEQSWPLINFMKQSLIELYSLDQAIAYKHCFIFLRQLAISLRNAMSNEKKETFRIVYNWQFVHSLLLWSQMLSSIYPSNILKPLIYPLVQIILGTIRLHPISRFYPLRVHLIRALIKLSSETDTFIPILPCIAEMLNSLETKKKSMGPDGSKEINFNVLLKVSVAQIHEKSFKEETVNKIYELLLEYLSSQSHRVAFVELVFMSCQKIRQFVKSCHVAHHCRLLKQVLDKIEENSKFIAERRKHITFGISDVAAIDKWEQDCKAEGTPLTKFYSQWKKQQLRKLKESEENESESDGDDNEVKDEGDRGNKLKAKKLDKKKKGKGMKRKIDDGEESPKRSKDKGQESNKANSNESRSRRNKRRNKKRNKDEKGATRSSNTQFDLENLDIKFDSDDEDN